ncbi:uncharacterized protein VTP21DRAFT_5856 [Calcarisporiella thermophila]|uniref:uncharacterized protein n=1 Tax=Calcarisporiella thermophila TaxID=911321 RepID=UPI0037433AF6
MPGMHWERDQLDKLLLNYILHELAIHPRPFITLDRLGQTLHSEFNDVGLRYVLNSYGGLKSYLQRFPRHFVLLDPSNRHCPNRWAVRLRNLFELQEDLMQVMQRLMIGTLSELGKILRAEVPWAGDVIANAGGLTALLETQHFSDQFHVEVDDFNPEQVVFQIRAFLPRYSPRTPPRGDDDQLSRAILDYSAKLEVKDIEEHPRRHELWDKLDDAFEKRWPGAGLTVLMYGSALNGLVLDGSDTDFVVMVPQDERYDKRGRLYPTDDDQFSYSGGSYYKMKVIASLLRSMGMQNVIPIGRARVPVCKFYDPELELHGDITINHRLSPINTELIQYYCDCDPRVRTLIRIVKWWARCRGINNPTHNRTPNSYAYTLMMINFLQTTRPPVLPNLQKQTSLWKERIREYHRTEGEEGYYDVTFTRSWHIQEYNGPKNKASVASLLQDFFYYFGEHFDPESFLVSVSSGQFVYRRFSRVSWVSEQAGNATLCVQDPFVTGRNVTAAVTPQAWARVQAEFKRAATIIQDERLSASFVLEKLMERA